MTTQISIHPQGGRYRADIDGIRALAVLSVVGFHAFPKSIPGGFVGVDIFFVISGYLISGIIFRELDERRFSLADFYARRIRRIFPALSLVLSACLIVGAYCLFPSALAQLGLHVFAGSAFVSNFLLWTESGYFDSASATKVLLHLWSLGVEEQYYLVWPLLLMVLGRTRRWRLALLIGIFTASFVANAVLVRTHPISDFYLPFTRFWELLLGAALTYANLYGPRRLDRASNPPRLDLLRNLLAWSGMLEIAASLWTFSEDQPFPGWLALLPAVGAVSLIGAGEGAWLNRRVFSTRVAVFFGLISYPLYLWHWPALVFQLITSTEYPSRIGRIAAVGASVCLAWLTYEFVEVPIRTSPRRSFVTKGLITAVGLIGIVGLSIYGDRGLPSRYPGVLRATALADQLFDRAVYREGLCLLQAEQEAHDFSPSCIDPVRGDDKPLILLWGDSHAASLYPGLRTVIDDSHTAFRLGQFTASACPPIVGFAVTNRPNCKAINDFVLHYVQANKPDTVIMAAAWSLYAGGDFNLLDLENIRITASAVKASGVRRVIIVGPLLRWKEHQPNVVLREWDRSHQVRLRTSLNFDGNVLDFNRRIGGILDRSVAAYFSPIDTLCNTQGCEVLVSRNGALFPLAWDDAHLTVEGSEELARDMMQTVMRGD